MMQAWCEVPLARPFARPRAWAAVAALLALLAVGEPALTCVPVAATHPAPGENAPPGDEADVEESAAPAARRSRPPEPLSAEASRRPAAPPPRRPGLPTTRRSRPARLPAEHGRGLPLRC